MALTAEVKDEISRLEVTKTCCRRAEVSALLRFGGSLHIISGHVVVEAEVDAGAIARRLRRDLADVYNADSDVAIVTTSSGMRKGSRYVVRIVRGADHLARQTGLVDGLGRPIRGLPPAVEIGRAHV